MLRLYKRHEWDYRPTDDTELAWYEQMFEARAAYGRALYNYRAKVRRKRNREEQARKGDC